MNLKCSEGVVDNYYPSQGWALVTNSLSTTLLSLDTQMFVSWYNLPYQKRGMELYVNHETFRVTSNTLTMLKRGDNKIKLLFFFTSMLLTLQSTLMA